MTEARLWTGGRIFTGRRYVEALLAEDGRVVGAGPSDSVRRLAPTGTERSDLAGRLVIPGLIDAHVHLAAIARRSAGFDASSVASATSLAERLAAWTAEHPDGPIVGWGWDPERWTGRPWPTVRDVDPATGPRSLVLHHVSGHAALVNSATLEALGIDPRRERPPDPTVGRFPDGRPNGLLLERALRHLEPIVASAGPLPPAALRPVLLELSPFGITTAGAMSASAAEVTALRDLASAKALSVSVRAYVRASERAGFRPERSPGPGARCAVVGVKEFLDGAFGPRTAWLSEPYADDPGTAGIPVGSAEELSALVAELLATGLTPALHAIGDRAVARALSLLPDSRDPDRPAVRIEHASLVPPGLLPDLDRLRPRLVVQPGFVWSDGWLRERIGPERARWAYPFRTLLLRGIPLAGSSDAPYDPIDPWRGIRAAVGRVGPDGRSANPDVEEALSPEEAVGLYTVGAAAAVGEPGRGHLEVGAVADLAVLSTPDLASAVRYPGVPVLETWVGGQRSWPRSPGTGG